MGGLAQTQCTGDSKLIEGHREGRTFNSTVFTRMATRLPPLWRQQELPAARGPARHRHFSPATFTLCLR